MKWPYQSRNCGQMVERPRWCHIVMVQYLICVLAPEVEHKTGDVVYVIQK
jgi:hypothetical protein